MSWDEMFDIRAALANVKALEEKVEELERKVATLENNVANQLYIEAPLSGGFVPRNRSITV